MADKTEDNKIDNMIVWGVIGAIFIALPFVVDLGIDLGFGNNKEATVQTQSHANLGFKYETIKAGDGESPTVNSYITINYSVKNAGGEELYKTKATGMSKLLKKEPKAIQDALMNMKVGGKSAFTLSEEQYKGFRIPGKKIELKGDLSFEVELLKTKEIPKRQPRKVKQVPPPADVAAPPADATKTDTGLAYKVLNAGTGTEKPVKSGAVKVHYTGWKTNGETFDSSVTRGKPATFGVGQVIAGWTEGLQLMTVGEKTRFWIPENLAYQGKREPKGMLVFDVELLEIIQPPKTPSLTAPKKAKKTKSGIAYEITKKGPGKVEIKADSLVTAHLSVWDLDGNLKQSSLLRGQAQRLMLAQPNLPALLKESAMLLKEGDSGRFWLPGDEKARGFAKKGLILEISVDKVMAAPQMPKMGGKGKNPNIKIKTPTAKPETKGKQTQQKAK